MRKLTGVLAVGLVMALVVSVTWAQGAGQGGQRRGGDMRGGMGRMSSIENDWATLCFDIGISADQITKLRPTFKWGWETQQTTVKNMMGKRDQASFQAAAKTMQQVNKTIQERIPKVLTKQQLAAWNKLQAEREAQMRKWISAAGARSGGAAPARPKQ